MRQAVLSSWQGAPYQVGYVAGTIGMLIISWVMLRSQIFSKATAYVGIVARLVGFGIYEPKVGVFISILSVVGMQVWYVMIALALFRHSNGSTQPAFPDSRVAVRESA